MPYVMGDRGDIVAILWADHNPLHAPPLATVNNKILWVSKMIPGPFTPLRIRATLDGTNQTVTRQVTGGPGPSIIDLPAAGCWSLSLSWSGHHDHLSLRYARRGNELTGAHAHLGPLQPLQHRHCGPVDIRPTCGFRNIGDGRAPFGNVGQTDHGHAGTKDAERP